MKLSTYYHSDFRGDLRDLIACAPIARSHTLGEITIQPRTLSTENPTVRAWAAERRTLFASSLFITIMADQVCYTYFRAQYPQFRALTRYPKLKGDCPGGCYTHIHSVNAFGAIGKQPGSFPGQDRDMRYELVPRDLLSVLKVEVSDFFARHLPTVSAEEFWLRCDQSIPFDLRIGLVSTNGDA